MSAVVSSMIRPFGAAPARLEIVRLSPWSGQDGERPALGETRTVRFACGAEVRLSRIASIPEALDLLAPVIVHLDRTEQRQHGRRRRTLRRLAASLVPMIDDLAKLREHFPPLTDAEIRGPGDARAFLLLFAAVCAEMGEALAVVEAAQRPRLAYLFHALRDALPGFAAAAGEALPQLEAEPGRV